MESQWFLWYLQFTVAFVAFESAIGLQLGVPTNPIFLNQNLNLTWVTAPSDPPSFNVDALCNNITVTLKTAVQGSAKHLSTPMSQLPQAARFPSGSCVLRATDTSNKSTLASSPSFVVLSANLPSSSIQSSPVSTIPPTTGSTASTISLSAPTSSFPVVGSISSSSSSSQSSDSGTSQSSSTSVLTSASEQLTTDAVVSVSGQTTAIMETFTTTDSFGNVLTITSQASVNIAGILTSALSGFTAVEKTTTITFVTDSSTSVTTRTFTTDVPIQSADSSGSSDAPRLNHTQVASIIGGTLGSVAILALLIFLACFLRRRRRRRRSDTSILKPLKFDPTYRQPPEKSGMHHFPSSFSLQIECANLLVLSADIPQPVQTQHAITSSTHLNLEVGSYVHLEDLEALTQDAVNARRLRLQVQRLSERVLELEDQQREIGTLGTHWPYSSMEDIHPPDYADTADSYTYAERITHG
ncbi:hypothetical protein C0995_000715 [Termitomyces sp. Mi166|nr:hypothetical protein C0995_000715 [Termitomyces sp. Mi166\